MAADRRNCCLKTKKQLGRDTRKNYNSESDYLAAMKREKAAKMARKRNRN